MENRNPAKALIETGAKEEQPYEDNLQCVCSSSNYLSSWESAHDARILECGWCGLKRTYPVPDSGVSAAIYQDTETTYPIENHIENKDLWRSFAEKVLKEVNKHRSGGNLLDVGCFIGTLLELAEEQGWNAYGVEINQGACEHASKNLGLNVFQGELANAGLQEHFFDAVICNHVLEHILDPLTFLIEIRRIMKPDGVLVIGVPNIDSWIAKYYGDRWYALALNQHIWHFCPATLESLLERCGFQILSLNTDLLWYEYPFNLKGIAKKGLFQFLRSIGKGDAILASATVEDRHLQS